MILIMSQDYGTVVLGGSLMWKITNLRFFTLLVILLEDAGKKKKFFLFLSENSAILRAVE